MKTLAIVSGGADSVTMAHYFFSMGHTVDFITFDYGQRHKKEIEYAKKHADKLGSRFMLVDISGIGNLLVSSLTGHSDVPLSKYSKQSMSSTVVPNRNSIMLNIAYGVATSFGYEQIGLGIHSGDHAIYPDCRMEFIEKSSDALFLATEKKIGISVPFIEMTKKEIISIGLALGVNYNETWSCYSGLDQPCGECATCIELAEAVSANKKGD